MDALLPVEDGVLSRPPTRGDRGASVESRLCSGVRLFPRPKLAWLGRGGGCTDFALAAREFEKCRVPSSQEVEPPSIDVLVEPLGVLSDKRLGRLFCVFLAPYSPSAMTPGPIDLRGGFAAATV